MNNDPGIVEPSFRPLKKRTLVVAVCLVLSAIVGVVLTGQPGVLLPFVGMAIFSLSGLAIVVAVMWSSRDFFRRY